MVRIPVLSLILVSLVLVSGLIFPYQALADGEALLEVFTTDDHSEVLAGEVLPYRIIVRNLGDHELTDVTVTDFLPPYLIPEELPEGITADPQTRTLTWVGQTISAGAEATFAFTARVEPPTPHGTVLNNRVVVEAADISQEAQDATLVLNPAATVPVTAKTGFEGVATFAALFMGGLGLLLVARRYSTSNN